MNNFKKAENFCREYLLDVLMQEGCALTDDLVLMSSSAGICMERLGLLKSDWAKTYISGRGGTYRLGDDVYTFRDIVDYLDGKLYYIEPIAGL